MLRTPFSLQSKFLSVRTNTSEKYSKNQVFILNYLINEIISLKKIFYNEVGIISNLNGFIQKKGGGRRYMRQKINGVAVSKAMHGLTRFFWRSR